VSDPLTDRFERGAEAKRHGNVGVTHVVGAEHAGLFDQTVIVVGEPTDETNTMFPRSCTILIRSLLERIT